MKTDKELLISNLLRILHEGATKLEKNIKPFWNKESGKNSKKLWLPTKEDTIESDLSGLNNNVNSSHSLNSWFTTNVKLASSNNHLQSLPTPIETKPKSTPQLKTMKIRIFPDTKQKKTLSRMFGISRWFYNHSLSLLRSLTNSPIKKKNKDGFYIYINSKVSNIAVRNFIRKVECNEEIEVDETNVYTFVDYIYKELRAEFPVSEENLGFKFPSIGFRGVIDSLVQNINSCISNGCNISSLRLKTKKDNNEFLPFDDWSTRGYNMIPRMIGDFKGHYRVGRKKISLENLETMIDEKAFSIIMEKDTGRYFLACPVTHECFSKIKSSVKPEKSDETQICFPKRDIASLDPGVRTFQSVYGLDHVVGIGVNDVSRFESLLLEADKETVSKKRKVKIRSRIKHLVDELHWKTIHYLTQNYETILLPDFRISQMVKGNKISKMTKRLMYAYRFFQFKVKLESKCIEHGCVLIIVDESYTSKTCGSCGLLNHTLGGNKHFECPTCGVEIDRDDNGARNILIKNLFS